MDQLTTKVTIDTLRYPPVSVSVYGRPPTQLIHTAKPFSKNYSSAESLCTELNRVLSAASVSFCIAGEGEKRFRLEALPKIYSLELKSGMNYSKYYNNSTLTEVGAVADFRVDLMRGTTVLMIYCSLCDLTL